MQHLAVFSTGGIESILRSEKTLESRLARFRFAPFNKIKKGDIVFMKESGGPVVGKFEAGQVTFLSDLDRKKVAGIRSRYGKQLQVGDGFWKQKKDAKYATFIKIKDPVKLNSPVFLDKHDRRSWIVIKTSPELNSARQLSLHFSDKDSLSGLQDLLKIASKNNTKENLGQKVLSLVAAVGVLSGSSKGKDSKKIEKDIAEVLLQVLLVAQEQNIDLYQVAKNKILDKGNKIAIKNLKELK